ncbi:unnamed protein product [Spodoptera exigua]|nr:unnamed protein product [Spodoptera exigua]
MEEPGTPESISAHAEAHNVKFDIFAKIDVNGETACDVWKFMKGVPMERYGPEVQPIELEKVLCSYW